VSDGEVLGDEGNGSLNPSRWDFGGRPVPLFFLRFAPQPCIMDLTKFLVHKLDRNARH